MTNFFKSIFGFVGICAFVFIAQLVGYNLIVPILMVLFIIGLMVNIVVVSVKETTKQAKKITSKIKENKKTIQNKKDNTL